MTVNAELGRPVLNLDGMWPEWEETDLEVDILYARRPARRLQVRQYTGGLLV